MDPKRVKFDIDNRLGTLATRLSCALQGGCTDELIREAKDIIEELVFIDKNYKLIDR